jgi:hypothetical protein
MAIFIFLVGIFNMRACVLKKSGMVAMPMTPPHTWGSYDPPTLGVPMTPHTWGSYDPPHTWGSYDPPTLGVPMTPHTLGVPMTPPHLGFLESGWSQVPVETT